MAKIYLIISYFFPFQGTSAGARLNQPSETQEEEEEEEEEEQGRIAQERGEVTQEKVGREEEAVRSREKELQMEKASLPYIEKYVSTLLPWYRLKECITTPPVSQIR